MSGICLLAKTSKALERLAAAFRDGDVHKTYWALCCAKPEPPEGQLEGWLNRNEQQNKSYIVADGTAPKPGRYPAAKLARLNYRYLRSTDRYHLVEVDLLTGRHHQIRCQLAHLGCPIKGDLKYGAPRSNPDGGICLHARRIRFTHPVRKEEMTVEAPVIVGAAHELHGEVLEQFFHQPAGAIAVFRQHDILEFVDHDDAAHARPAADAVREQARGAQVPVIRRTFPGKGFAECGIAAFVKDEMRLPEQFLRLLGVIGSAVAGSQQDAGGEAQREGGQRPDNRSPSGDCGDARRAPAPCPRSAARRNS